jgi:hypothetical protein
MFRPFDTLFESCRIPSEVLAYVGYRTFVLLAASYSVIDTRDDHGRHELRQVSNQASL